MILHNKALKRSGSSVLLPHASDLTFLLKPVEEAETTQMKIRGEEDFYLSAAAVGVSIDSDSVLEPLKGDRSPCCPPSWSRPPPRPVLWLPLPLLQDTDMPLAMAWLVTHESSTTSRALDG